MAVCADRGSSIDDSGHTTGDGAMDSLQDPRVEAAGFCVRSIRSCRHSAKESKGFMADSAAYFDAKR